MHMADALLSPAVGGTMWAVSAGAAVYSVKKVKTELDEKKVPLMGVLGAFIFAAQMINFTIPGTGSSGHLGGGLILAVLLGPYAAFLTMFSILMVQALFFADGGLLALGCNIFNLGFVGCFIAYPLIYKHIVRKISSRNIFWGSLLTAIIGLQLGAFGVVMETVFSGISELPVTAFFLLMQPIHFAIGIVEGLVSAAVITFVWKARPEIVEQAVSGKPYEKIAVGPVLVGLIVIAMITGSTLSWFASTHPDGLEWSIDHTSGREELRANDNIHHTLAEWQGKTAFLPDYGFKKAKNLNESSPEASAWPVVNGGTSISGLLGGALTLLMALAIGYGIRLFKKMRRQ
jgi:cobalt/nickel transport system permease protein